MYTPSHLNIITILQNRMDNECDCGLVGMTIKACGNRVFYSWSVRRGVVVATHVLVFSPWPGTLPMQAVALLASEV